MFSNLLKNYFNFYHIPDFLVYKKLSIQKGLKFVILERVKGMNHTKWKI